MKVNLDFLTEQDEINFCSYDLNEGIMISTNPKGVIMGEPDEYYDFFSVGNTNEPEYSADTLKELGLKLIEHYPNITFEYFPYEN